MSTPCRLRNNSTNGMKTLGIDVGSSSVKVSLLDVATGECAGAVTLPSAEMPIDAPQPGWAEQDPRMWWNYVREGVRTLVARAGGAGAVKAIGITYQMHGLVCLDEAGEPVAKIHYLVRQPGRGDRGSSVRRTRTRSLSGTPVEFARKFYGLQTGLGAGERAGSFCRSASFHAARRLRAVPVDGRNVYDPQRTVRADLLGLH